MGEMLGGWLLNAYLYGGITAGDLHIVEIEYSSALGDDGTAGSAGVVFQADPEQIDLCAGSTIAGGQNRAAAAVAQAARDTGVARI